MLLLLFIQKTRLVVKNDFQCSLETSYTQYQMNSRVTNSITSIKQYSIVLVFALIGIVSAYVSIDSFINMLNQIFEKSDQVEFDKGVYYLFGGGLFFLLMVLGFFAVKVLKVSQTIEKIIVLLMVTSLVLVFALPQIIHYSVSTYLEDQGYQICKEKSRRWLHVVTIVYTKSIPCDREN